MKADLKNFKLKLTMKIFRADDFKINGGNSLDCFINDSDPFKFNAGQVRASHFNCFWESLIGISIIEIKLCYNYSSAIQN